jgi:RNA polymerase sigma factor (sigma-70 family)
MATQQLDGVVQYLRQLGGDPDAERVSDRELLRRFAAEKDQGAFATLVRRHGPLVLGVCWRELRHTQDAEDAFQAAFLVLARKAGSVSWQECVASWLHEVAGRVSAEAKSRALRRRVREKQMDPMPDVACAPQAVQPEMDTVLDQELRRLPERYRAPLLLCCLEGRSRDEAAEQLGWSLGKVKGRLERGRQLLRRRLARRGLTLPAVLTPLLLPATAPANVTPVLLNRTLRLVAALAIKEAGNRLAVAPAAVLAEGVLRTMFLARVKLVAAVLLAVLTLGAIAGAVTFCTPRLQDRAPQSDHQARPPKTDRAAVQTAAVKRPSGEQPGGGGPEGMGHPYGAWRPSLIVEHGGTVRTVIITPDGRRAASPCFDGVFRVWDVATGQTVHEWHSPGRNSALAVSPDGRLLAGGNDRGDLYVWDLATGKTLCARPTRQGNIYHLAFSPDGQTLATANHLGTISLFDARSGASLSHLIGHNGRVWWVAFAPDGETLASADENGIIRLWDLAAGRERRQLLGHQGYAAAAVFSPDGRQLASGGIDGTVRLWDPATGQELRQMKTGPTQSVAFAPDGKTLASCDRAHEIHLWDVQTGAKLHTLRGHTDQVHGVTFAPDGSTLASAGEDRTVRFWIRPNKP